MKRLHISLSIALTSLFYVSFAGAADSQWYWVSVPSDPSSGYFIEEMLPNTIGYEDVDSVSSDNNLTPVPDDFMETLEAAEDYGDCSGETDSAVKKLRRFDSNEDLIINNYKCSFDCGPYYISDAVNERAKLMRDIEDDAEQCIADAEAEEERVKEESKREIEVRRRQLDVEEAVRKCDFTFFEEEMTSRERMQTYDERLACEESGGEGVEVDESEQQVDVNRNELLKQIQKLLQLIIQLQTQLTAKQGL